MTMISRVEWLAQSNIDKLEDTIALKITPPPQISITLRKR